MSGAAGDFQSRLRTLREAKGFANYREFASAVGVTEHAAWNWETGFRYPSKGMTRRIAQVLDVPSETLLMLHPRFHPDRRDKSKTGALKPVKAGL